MPRTPPAQTLKKQIYSILERPDPGADPELRGLLKQWWSANGVEFGTKMEAWKADRIERLEWRPPVLRFSITRHPGAWDRVQRWEYDFAANEARRSWEGGVRQNESYTKKQAAEDARQILEALLRGAKHPCIQQKGDQRVVWLGRLEATKPRAYELPQRTAKGRQARLKEEIVSLMAAHSEFERLPPGESRGSLVYKAKVGTKV